MQIKIRQLEYERDYYRKTLLEERKHHESNVIFEHEIEWNIERILEQARDYLSATKEEDLKRDKLIDILWQDIYGEDNE